MKINSDILDLNVIELEDKSRLHHCCLAIDEKRQISLIHAFWTVIEFLDELITNPSYWIHNQLIKEALSNNIDYKSIENFIPELIDILRLIKANIEELPVLKLAINEIFKLLPGEITIALNRKQLEVNSENIAQNRKLTDPLFELFIKDGLFIWDAAVIKYLENEKSDLVNPFRKLAINAVEEYKAKGSNPIEYWFNFKNRNQLHESPILIDIIADRFPFSKTNWLMNNPAGLVAPVMDLIIQITGGSTENSVKNAIRNTLKELIQEDMLDTLATLTAIELLLYFTKEVHTKRAMGYENWTDLEFPGGYTEIAEKIGKKSGTDKVNIKYIITILNTTEFKLPNIISKFINVASCKPNSEYSRKGGLLVTILPPLRPHFVNEFKKPLPRIVPVPEEIRFSGRNNKRSAQKRLQLLYMIEFTKNSERYRKHGSIHISTKKQQDFFREVGITKKTEQITVMKAATEKNGYLEDCGNNEFKLKNNDAQAAFIKQFTSKKKIKRKLTKNI